MNERKVKVSCQVCGTTNFYPLDAAGKKVICGRCRSELPRPGTVLESSIDGLYKMIQTSSLPVLVDFYSPTCGPCHLMHPIVERLAERRTGELMVVRFNIDQAPGVATGFRVHAVPTFLVLHKGVERARTTGAMPETDFSLWVASAA
jgi:thioredoxin 2